MFDEQDTPLTENWIPITVTVIKTDKTKIGLPDVRNLFRAKSSP